MKTNLTLFIISAVVPGMVAGMGWTQTRHMVWATGKTSAVLNFIREHPLAHDIESATPEQVHMPSKPAYWA